MIPDSVCAIRRLMAPGMILAAFLLGSVTPHAVASEPESDLPGSHKLGIGSTRFGRWPGGVVTWVYNPTGVPAEFSSNSYFLELFERAIDEIEGVSGVSFVYNGVDAAADIDNTTDGIVVVAWEDIGGAAGRAGPTSFCSGQDITDNGYCPYIDGKVRFNNNDAAVDWDSSGNTDTMERTLVQVATHELLHLLGIGHSEEHISIMYADPYTNLSHLRDDDIDALQGLYGPPDVFVGPETWTVAQPTNGDPIDSFMANSDDTGTEISMVDDADTSTFVGPRWSVSGPYNKTVTVVAVDPEGYYYGRNQTSVSCPLGFNCAGWFSAVQTATMQTFPGDWTFAIIVEGVTDEVLTVDASVSPTHNEPPDSTLAFTRTRGVIPLRFAGRLEVTGDDEGDTVDATWHIPGDGETDVNFGGSTGQSFQDFTFDDEGSHEVFVETNDDWTRYGSPGSGSEAGPGFRGLYRQVFTAEKTLTDTVGLDDVNADGFGDIAVLLDSGDGVSNRLLIIEGDTGNTLYSRSIGNSDISIKQIKVIGDVNADGIRDIAVLARNLVQGGVFIDITDPVTGNQIRRIFYEAAFEPIAIAEVPIGGGLGGGVGLGVLGEDAGTFRIQLKNGVTEVLISKIFFDPAYYPQGVEVLDSIDGDGVADYAVVGLDSAGRVRAQLKDTVSGALEGFVYFDKRYWPLAIDSGVDLDMNGVTDLVVLGTDPFGRIRAQAKDPLSGALTGLVYFQKGLEFLDFVVVPDIGSPSFGVLARDPATDVIRTQLKNASTGALESLSRFNSANDPWGLAVVPDTNGSASELSVLGEAGNGNMTIQMKDAVTTAPLLNRVVP